MLVRPNYAETLPSLEGFLRPCLRYVTDLPGSSSLAVLFSPRSTPSPLPSHYSLSVYFSVRQKPLFSKHFRSFPCGPPPATSMLFLWVTCSCPFRIPFHSMHLGHPQACGLVGHSLRSRPIVLALCVSVSLRDLSYSGHFPQAWKSRAHSRKGGHLLLLLVHSRDAVPHVRT